MCKTLFMRILHVLLQAFNCSYTSTGPIANRSVQALTWIGDSSLECWKNEHLVIVVLSAFAIVDYYPFAVRLAPAWQYIIGTLDINYRSSYLIISLQIKFVLVFFTVFFSYIPNLYLSVCVIGISALVILQFIMKPANIKKINNWRMTFLCCALWTVICSLTTYFIIDGADSLVPTIMLFVGWAIIIFIGLSLSVDNLRENLAHRSRALAEMGSMKSSYSSKSINTPRSTDQTNIPTSQPINKSSQPIITQNFPNMNIGDPNLPSNQSYISKPFNTKSTVFGSQLPFSSKNTISTPENL